MSPILVIAPHADDETLGCGGTLLRYRASGAEIHWLLITQMSAELGYNNAQMSQRQTEINQVAAAYRFSSVHQLTFPTTRLDTVASGDLIGAISAVVAKIKPAMVLCPFRNDAHSDHQVVFDCVMAATKSFRAPFIKKVMCYETLSETDFGMKPEAPAFKPNVFIDITDQLAEKLNIMQIFKSELAEFPFPRSLKAIEALASLRGSQANAHAAEAFLLLKEII